MCGLLALLHALLTMALVRVETTPPHSRFARDQGTQEMGLEAALKM